MAVATSEWTHERPTISDSTVVHVHGIIRITHRSSLVLWLGKLQAGVCVCARALGVAEQTHSSQIRPYPPAANVGRKLALPGRRAFVRRWYDSRRSLSRTVGTPSMAVV